jgi:tetratricopeptide (TPR) repeat protein
MASTNKLHPIYVALDNHQYNRAIKLCSAHPSTNVLCQALLAHSYVKAGQPFKSLLTIQKILPSSVDSNANPYFPEFQSEVRRLNVVEGNSDVVVNTPANVPSAVTSNSKKITKAVKGKKKPPASIATSQLGAVQQSISQASVPDGWDLIDHLDTPPILPEDWERLPPAEAVSYNNSQSESSLIDPTTLSTLSMTLVNHLKLPLTAYQLYCWAALSATQNDSVDEELFIRKAFTNGLIVLLSPQYQYITSAILSNLQVLALQLARLNATSLSAPANLWAAQTALWQIQYTASSSESLMDDKLKARIAMLPRLAESLASKSYNSLEKFINQSNNQSQQHDGEIGLVSTESFLLYTRTLDIQGESRYQEKLNVIEQKLCITSINNTQSTGGLEQQMMMTYPSRQTVLQMKVETLQKLGKFHEARLVLEELIDLYPDDWEYWKLHLECSIAAVDGDIVSGCKQTTDKAAIILNNLQDKMNRRYPLRGPRWIELEAASLKLKSNNQAAPNSLDVENLIDCIQRYGNEFASCASSTYSDLSSSLERCLESCSNEHAESILEWAKSLMCEPTSNSIKERRSELRTYICSIQINFNVISKFPALREKYIPSWKDILDVWKKFQSFEDSNDSDQVS